MLILAPALFSWGRQPRLAMPSARALEFCALVAVAALSGELVFGGWLASTPIGSRPYLVIPVLLWAAFRFGVRETSSTAVLLSGIAIAHTWLATRLLTGPAATDPAVFSPFVNSGATPNDLLLSLQAFICLIAIMALALAQAVAERDRLNAELEQRVRERTSELETANGDLLREIRERQRAEEEIRRLSITDALSGLYNRRGFMLLAEREWRVAQRTKQPCEVLFLDLDDLKQVNDTHGHAAGDALIADMARLLKQTFRETDVVARLGGDEFTVLLPLATDAENPGARFQAALEVFNRDDSRPNKLSASIGYARHEPGGRESLEELLVRADADMYAHKHR